MDFRFELTTGFFSSPSRNTLAELYPSKQMPAFPVNILPTSGALVRDLSPTKSLYGSSPTNSLVSVGRRSPNLDSQMDAIAEDCTEDLATPTVTPTDTIPPATLVPDSSLTSSLRGADTTTSYPRHGGRTSLGANEPIFPRIGNRISVGGNEAPAFQRTGRTSVGGGDAPTAFQRTGRTSLSGNEAWHARTTGNPTYQQPMVPPGDDKRQRRTGASMLQSSSYQPNPAPAKNGLHQLLMSAGNNHLTKTTPSSNNHLLLSMLQSPLSNPQPQQREQNPNQLISSEYINSSTGSSYNTTQQPSQDMLGMAALVQIQQLANHVSTVLNNFGLPHVHQNNVFTVDHHGVRFQIHVARNIQLQYVAGDMMQYQSLCSQLYSSLVPTTQ